MLSVLLLATLVGATAKPHCRNNWCASQKSHEDATVHVTFGVKLRNMEDLEAYLLEISNPTSLEYGNFLTMEEVHSFTSSPNSAGKVVDFLASHGIKSHVTKGFDFVRADIPVSVASNIFNGADFMEYKHQTTGRTVHRSAKHVSVPVALNEHVDFLAGVHDLPFGSIFQPSQSAHAASKPVIIDEHNMQHHKPPQNRDDPANIGTIIATYSISLPTKIASNSSQSVVEALGQQFSPSDLSQFLKGNNVPDQKVAKVIGSNDPTQCTSNPDNCGEANLDVQVMLGLAQEIPMTYYSMPNSDQTPFYDWLVELSQNPSPPLVTSVSYGGVENDPDSTSNNARVNQEFIKAGARGLTIVFASGDDGVANYIARTDATQCGFNPSFPATSPYVLAVGATQFITGKQGEGEMACTSNNIPSGGITSGGGFSNQFARPAYQADAVSNYLNTAVLPNVPQTGSNAPSAGFNIKGRGYPDVAALGHNYPIVIGGNVIPVDGTSASTPLFASLLSLANNERLLAGKTPLGFVNPLLYKLAVDHPEVFNDVTQGTNNCAAKTGTPVCCKNGFDAAPGWDPVTGLGSMNYNFFIKYVVEM